MEAIESIKIVQVDGLMQKSGGAGGGNGSGGGSGNLANDAVAAALAYRAQAPVLDGLMKELGLDGSSLNSLVAGPSGATEAAPDSRAAEGSGKSRPAPTRPAIGNDRGEPEDKDDPEEAEAAE
jgi:hypothetical protein